MERQPGEEIVGAARAAAALESWACAAKLGLLRAATREDDQPAAGGGYHGDLPDGWSKSLAHDVALALAMSPVSAENLLQTAWDLGAMLPGIGALLQDGTLTYPKARVVRDALELLGEEDKTTAEAMIAERLAGKTFGQVDKIAAQAAITVDPELAERTREHAERNRARVILKRERSGAASLLGCDLPPAETLAAHAATCARAQVYKDSGAFPGVLMDQFRAMAYLDLMNEISAPARTAAAAAGSASAVTYTAATTTTATTTTATVVVAVVRVALIPGPAQAHRPDDPPRHAPRAAEASRREPGLLAPRPRALPRPGRARRGQPAHHRVRHRHRRERVRHRPRLPAVRPQETPLPGSPDPPLTALPAALNLSRTTPPGPAGPRIPDRLGPHPARHP
jgi:Domain of unknown function (DUF222)